MWCNWKSRRSASSYKRKYYMPLEVHAHINGSIEEHTIKHLIEKKRAKQPEWKSPCNLHFEHGELRSLPEVFSLFKLTQELCDNEESAYTITSDVICDFANDNVKYLELRTTPRDQPSTGMTKKSYLESVIKAIKEKDDSLDIIVKLLVSVDRRGTLDYAWDTLKLTEEMRDRHGDIVVGLDLSGDPHKGDATVFAPVFRAAKDKGFRLSLHLAEISGQNEECRELLQLPPDRIGHGTFIHPSLGGTEEILEQLDGHHIPFEVCLSSNVCTRTSASYAEHHFRKWYERNHPLVIATDDKGVFSTSLSKEYSIVADTFGLNKKDLWNLSYRSIDYIFANESVKDILRKKWNMVKNELLLEHFDDT